MFTCIQSGIHVRHCVSVCVCLSVCLHTVCTYNYVCICALCVCCVCISVGIYVYNAVDCNTTCIRYTYTTYVHCRFQLKRLKQCKDDVKQIAHCFINIWQEAEGSKIYSDYCTKYPKLVISSNLSI